MTQNLTEEQKHGVQSVINHGLSKQQKLGKKFVLLFTQLGEDY